MGMAKFASAFQSALNLAATMELNPPLVIKGPLIKAPAYYDGLYYWPALYALYTPWLILGVKPVYYKDVRILRPALFRSHTKAIQYLMEC